MATLDGIDVMHLSAAAMCEAEEIHVSKSATQRLLALSSDLARELRELHDHTGISLDNWLTARQFVEAFTGPIVENHA